LRIGCLPCSELFEGKPGVFEDAKKQTLRKVLSAVYSYGDRFSIRVLQYQMGPRLAGFDIPVSTQKADLMMRRPIETAGVIRPAVLNEAII